MAEKIIVYTGSDTVTKLFGALPKCHHMRLVPHSNEKYVCYALERESKCEPTKCPFYQDEKDYEESLERANERLRSLNPVMQKDIADKYYGGKPTW